MLDALTQNEVQHLQELSELGMYQNKDEIMKTNFGFLLQGRVVDSDGYEMLAPEFIQFDKTKRFVAKSLDEDIPIVLLYINEFVEQKFEKQYLASKDLHIKPKYLQQQYQLIK